MVEKHVFDVRLDLDPFVTIGRVIFVFIPGRRSSSWKHLLLLLLDRKMETRTSKCKTWLNSSSSSSLSWLNRASCCGFARFWKNQKGKKKNNRPLPVWLWEVLWFGFWELLLAKWEGFFFSVQTCVKYGTTPDSDCTVLYSSTVDNSTRVYVQFIAWYRSLRMWCSPFVGNLQSATWTTSEAGSFFSTNQIQFKFYIRFRLHSRH